MAASGGTARRYLLRTTAISLAICSLVVIAACGSTSDVAAAPSVGNSLVPAAGPSPSAGLSPEMTLGAVPAVPPVPALEGADECVGRTLESVDSKGVIECQYFTSGAMTPPSVTVGEGVGSGDYAVRFASVDGSPLMTVRIPCASFAVRVGIEDHTITPDPATLESLVESCTFPWDEGQQRMARYLQAPLQLAEGHDGVVLSNSEWGVTLFRTPYETV